MSNQPPFFESRSFPGEKKGQTKLRHKKEREQLELWCRQKKFDKKVAKELQKQLEQMHESELKTEVEAVSDEQMLRDLQDHKEKLQLKSAGLQRAFARNQEMEAARQEYLLTAGADRKQIETDKIAAKLRPLGLKILRASADGDCLYHAVALVLQLKVDLRQQLAAFVLQNRDQYEETAVLLHESLDRYLEKLKGNEWGDEFEVQLLATMLKKRIVVFNAFMRELVYGEEFADVVNICYHLDYNAAGAHYNATEPL